MAREHIPKKHLDFENPIRGKAVERTSDRIYGESRPELMNTNNTEYGTGKNSTAGMTRIGRKNAMQEREIERQVMQEMAERHAAHEAKNEERYFDTTNQENLCGRDLTQNTVGRKVM